MNKDAEKKENQEDNEDILSTQVLERLTDASYDSQPAPEEKKETKENKDFFDEDEMSKTSILEQLTDPEEMTASHQKDELNAPKKETEAPVTPEKEVLSFIRDLAICIVAVFLITSFIFLPVQVKGNSMYPELNDKALGFSNVMGYNISGLKRFDVVIVYVAEKDEYLVKRVIGLPGETVSYLNGQLYINGAAVKEDFLDKDYVASYNGTFMQDVSAITLGDDEYYCLGDNRPHSTDSRYYGPFKKSNIKSKGIFIFWPFSQFGVVSW